MARRQPDSQARRAIWQLDKLAKRASWSTRRQLDSSTRCIQAMRSSLSGTVPPELMLALMMCYR
jgi:hypothetical protein